MREDKTKCCLMCGKKLGLFNNTGFCNAFCERWYNMKNK